MVGEEYGVKYSPSESVPTGLSSTSLQGLKSLIDFVQVVWSDYTNTTRCRVLPWAYFAKNMQSSRPGVSIAKVVLLLVDLQHPGGYGPEGEWHLAIDISTIRLCPYQERTAIVMGYFQEKWPAILENPSASPHDPRSILRRIVDEARSVARVNFLVGFEIEFTLLRSSSRGGFVNEEWFSTTSSLRSGTVETAVLTEITNSLKNGGVELQMFHAEAAPGQYELVLAPLPPIEAADALIYTRETMYNVASKHNLRATVAPRLYSDNCGNAMHTHISAHPLGRSTPSSTPNLNKTENSFLAGLLQHLPAIQAFTMALPPSYDRMVDGIWSGGTYVCWGDSNKEVPVRLCNRYSDSSRNFEVKCVDGLTNPYLALAAMLGAGTLGIVQEKDLIHKDVSSGSAANLDENTRREEYGITERMSLTWDEARTRLAQDADLVNLFGEETINGYLGTNKIMAEWLDKPEGEVARVRKLIEHF